MSILTKKMVGENGFSLWQQCASSHLPIHWFAEMKILGNFFYTAKSIPPSPAHPSIIFTFFLLIRENGKWMMKMELIGNMNDNQPGQWATNKNQTAQTTSHLPAKGALHHTLHTYVYDADIETYVYDAELIRMKQHSRQRRLHKERKHLVFVGKMN